MPLHMIDILDNVCNEIIELTPNGVYQYKGSYEYCWIKNNRTQPAGGANKNLFKTELEWLRRQPKKEEQVG